MGLDRISAAAMWIMGSVQDFGWVHVWVLCGLVQHGLGSVVAIGFSVAAWVQFYFLWVQLDPVQQGLNCYS